MVRLEGRLFDDDEFCDQVEHVIIAVTDTRGKALAEAGYRVEKMSCGKNGSEKDLVRLH